MEAAEIQALTEAVLAVCPIDGVSSTGRIDFKDEATQEQKNAAYAVLKSFVYIPSVEQLDQSSTVAALREQLAAQSAQIAQITAMLANLAKTVAP